MVRYVLAMLRYLGEGDGGGDGGVEALGFAALAGYADLCEVFVEEGVADTVALAACDERDGMLVRDVLVVLASECEGVVVIAGVLVYKGGEGAVLHVHAGEGAHAAGDGLGVVDIDTVGAAYDLGVAKPVGAA